MFAIGVFFVLSLAISWTIWGIGAAGAEAAPLSVIAAGTFGPAAAGLLVGLGRDGPAETGRRLWRALGLGARPGLAVGFLLLPFASAIASAIAAAWPDVAGAGLERLPRSLTFALAAAALGGPLGEELGWRRFALAPLVARLGFLKGCLMLGVVWGIWHAPLYAVGVPGYPPGVAAGVARHLAICAPLSLILGALHLRGGGSVWPVVGLHAAINLSDDPAGFGVLVIGLLAWAGRDPELQKRDPRPALEDAARALA
jgi:hypothetical protein